MVSGKENVTWAEAWVVGGGAGRLLEYRRAGRVSRRPAPERRLSWNSIRWQIRRLEAVDRHCVGFVADLELESERRTAKHIVCRGQHRQGLVVGGREGLAQKPWGRRGAPVAGVELAQL